DRGWWGVHRQQWVEPVQLLNDEPALRHQRVHQQRRALLATAIIGAVFGALLAYAVATGNPNGVFRRLVSSACGVLAQFGGVTLAFAFIATLGSAGLITLWLKQHGMNIYANGVWLYQLRG